MLHNILLISLGAGVAWFFLLKAIWPPLDESDLVKYKYIGSSLGISFFVWTILTFLILFA